MATASQHTVAASQAPPPTFRTGTFALHLGVTCGLMIASTIAWLSGSIEFVIGMTLIGFVANVSLVAIESHNIIVQKGNLAPLLIVGGTLFWFVLDATVLALGDVPFSSRYQLYPYFAAGIPPEIAGKTLFGVFLFQFCGLIGIRYIPVPRRIVDALARRTDVLSGSAMDAACLVISLLSYIPISIVAGDWTQIFNRLVEMRNAEASLEFAGGDPGLWIHLSLLGIFGGALSAARFLIGVPGNTLIRLMSVGVTALWVFLSGTRFLMIFLILPTLVVLTYQAGGTARTTKLRMKLLVVTAIAAAALLVQAALRDVGVEGYSRYEQTSDVIKGGAVGYEHFEAMAIAIDLADRENVFFHEFLLPVIARHFVPRVWWPEKPDWESWAFYNDAVTAQVGSFNVTPSVTGQYYLNWGLWGIAYIGFFFGWLGRCADECLRRVSLTSGFCVAVFCGFFFGFLFVSFRILSPIYIAYVVGATVVLLILTRSGRKAVVFKRA